MLPAHGDALALGGADWLTQAFRAFGSIAPGNAISRIVRLERCPGGSTGAKFLLDVEYARPGAGLHERLFVKFSRDFADPRRDHPGRYEMASEAPFMALARLPGFPVDVARPYFADYQQATGTGIVITERVPFGDGAIEPHRPKCLDFATMDDPLPYYRATVTALARLSGAHKAGRLASDIDARFPFDPVAGTADPIRYDEAALRAELDYGFAFVDGCAHLFPARVREGAFRERMVRDALLVREHEAAIQRWLRHDPAMIALNHWNAHIDNAFFRRDAAGALSCGLIDWGRVGQITMGSALWGGLSAAHHDVWDNHLDELLALFVHEHRIAGGPGIAPAALMEHLLVHIATMGVARVLAFPEIIAFRLPGIASIADTHAPELLAIEPARNCLHVYTVFLKLWERHDFGAVIRRILAPSMNSL